MVLLWLLQQRECSLMRMIIEKKNKNKRVNRGSIHELQGKHSWATWESWGRMEWVWSWKLWGQGGPFQLAVSCHSKCERLSQWALPSGNSRLSEVQHCQWLHLCSQGIWELSKDNLMVRGAAVSGITLRFLYSHIWCLAWISNGQDEKLKSVLTWLPPWCPQDDSTCFLVVQGSKCAFSKPTWQRSDFLLWPSLGSQIVTLLKDCRGVSSQACLSSLTRFLVRGKRCLTFNW